MLCSFGIFSPVLVLVLVNLATLRWIDQNRKKIDWLKAIKNVLLEVPIRCQSRNFTTLVPVVAVAATVDCGRR
jgi:hypothetical protein